MALGNALNGGKYEHDWVRGNREFFRPTLSPVGMGNVTRPKTDQSRPERQSPLNPGDLSLSLSQFPGRVPPLTRSIYLGIVPTNRAAGHRRREHQRGHAENRHRMAGKAGVPAELLQHSKAPTIRKSTVGQLWKACAKWRTSGFAPSALPGRTTSAAGIRPQRDRSPITPADAT